MRLIRSSINFIQDAIGVYPSINLKCLVIRDVHVLKPLTAFSMTFSAANDVMPLGCMTLVDALIRSNINFSQFS